MNVELGYELAQTNSDLRGHGGAAKRLRVQSPTWRQHVLPVPVLVIPSMIWFPPTVRKQRIRPPGNPKLAVRVSVSASGCFSPRCSAINCRPSQVETPPLHQNSWDGLGKMN